MFPCLGHAQNLLKAVSSTLHKVSSSTSLLPLGSLSGEAASPNPGSPAGKWWEFVRGLSREEEGPLQMARLLAKESQ